MLERFHLNTVFPEIKLEGDDIWQEHPIPEGSADYAIDGIRHLLSRSTEGFSFNDSYQVSQIMESEKQGRSIENLHVVFEEGAKDIVRYYFRGANLDLTPSQLREKLILHDLFKYIPALVEKYVPSEKELDSRRTEKIKDAAHQLVFHDSRQFDTYDKFLAHLKERIDEGKEIVYKKGERFRVLVTPEAVLTFLQTNREDCEEIFLNTRS